MELKNGPEKFFFFLFKFFSIALLSLYSVVKYFFAGPEYGKIEVKKKNWHPIKYNGPQILLDVNPSTLENFLYMSQNHSFLSNTHHCPIGIQFVHLKTQWYFGLKKKKKNEDNQQQRHFVRQLFNSCLKMFINAHTAY